jgi:hypothetical protein
VLCEHRALAVTLAVGAHNALYGESTPIIAITGTLVKIGVD